MSLSPNSCRKGQLAGNQPTLPNSTVVGVNLQVIEDTSNSTGVVCGFFDIRVIYDK